MEQLRVLEISTSQRVHVIKVWSEEPKFCGVCDWIEAFLG